MNKQELRMFAAVSTTKVTRIEPKKSRKVAPVVFMIGRRVVISRSVNHGSIKPRITQGFAFNALRDEVEVS